MNCPEYEFKGMPDCEINTNRVSGVIFVMKDGSIMGNANMKRWSEATRWQRFLGFFSRRYKNRFIDIDPIKIKTND